MDFQNQINLKLTSYFKVIGYDNKTLINAIEDAFVKSNRVYIYRSLSHLKIDNDFIKWAKKNASSKCKRLVLTFDKYNRVEEITPERPDDTIYNLILNNDNRAEIRNMFKISITQMIGRILRDSSDYYKEPLFIDDPSYDQYDFIFANDDEIVLRTSIHSFHFLIADNHGEL